MVHPSTTLISSGVPSAIHFLRDRKGCLGIGSSVVGLAMRYIASSTACVVLFQFSSMCTQTVTMSSMKSSAVPVLGSGTATSVGRACEKGTDAASSFG